MNDSAVNAGFDEGTDEPVSHPRHTEPVRDRANRLKNGRQTHGMNLVMRATRELNRSRKTLDRRTGAGKWLHERREALIEALGGQDVISPQLEAIVDSTVRTELLLGHVDAYLLEIGRQVVNRRRRTLVAVAQQRTQLADSLLRHMDKLGLSRRAKPAETLAAFTQRMAAREKQEAAVDAG